MPTAIDSTAVSAMLLELDALRKRLDQKPVGHVGVGVAIRVAELAQGVKLLCQRAYYCGDPFDADSLLAESKTLLDEMQVLLSDH